MGGSQHDIAVNGQTGRVAELMEKDGQCVCVIGQHETGWRLN